MTFSPLHPSDAALLDMLTATELPKPTKRTKFARRDEALDPLLIAAAAASGPHMTRNHYAHDFFPGVQLPDSNGDAWNWSSWKGQDVKTAKEKQRRSSNAKLAYVSRQAPRRERLGIVDNRDADSAKENNFPGQATPPSPSADRQINYRSESTSSPTSLKSPLSVRCMARTRIPTPHGPVFLHLYHNNRDSKEHLALVVDSAQFEEADNFSLRPIRAPFIRSKSLDAVWGESETEMDRLTRGAYVGRLSAESRLPSHPGYGPNTNCSHENIPSPLIRIHSECFTGETIGSMRCDCGEQLDEAIRQISQPISIPSSTGSLNATLPGRGTVIYMRQEGRGIGLLSKIKAYNLQDMGHDTVAANLMLGHKADERGYEIAAAILRDLGLAGEDPSSGVRVLTNNPDKVHALQEEGIRVVERVPMIPRSWQARQNGSAASLNTNAGATMIGGKAIHGQDLDKYLRTKVVKMGHMLPLWAEDFVES